MVDQDHVDTIPPPEPATESSFPPLIYVAAPYRSATGWGIEQNIIRARQVGAAIASLGAMPVIPHANTAHFDGIQPDEFWLRATLGLLSRCDACFLALTWAESSGARAERDWACAHSMPTFSAMGTLERWIEQWNAGMARP